MWQVQPSPQDDTGFHRGANICQLSQFAHEQEVLFPPCTMMTVLTKSGSNASEGNEGVSRDGANLQVTAEVLGRIRFDTIQVLASFV